jgi:2-dehydro-3-deoxy-phosphogluconate/2-dehydro-3-deoxy-6-phosphogalactonate aldolase
MAEMIVPVLTPFVDSEVAPERLRSHAESLLQAGIDCIFLCGTTGLSPSLSVKEKLACLKALEGFADRTIFQVGSLNLSESLELAEAAKRAKVRAIASYPGYFYPRFEEAWAEQNLTRLSRIHPLLAYNFPLATGFEIGPSLIRKVKSNGGDVIGVKDTVSDVGHMLSFKYELGKEFAVYSGPDPLVLAAVRSGLDGSVAGSGNYAPELLVRIRKDPFSEDAAEAQRLITRLSGVSKKFGQWAANYAMTKTLRGYDVGGPRPPIFPLSDASVESLKKDVEAVYTSQRRGAGGRPPP